MNRGTVVRLVGTNNIDDDFDDQAAAVELELDPSTTVFSADRTGFYSMNEATRILIQRGCKIIHGLKAIKGLDGKMHAIGEPSHLFG